MYCNITIPLCFFGICNKTNLFRLMSLKVIQIYSLFLIIITGHLQPMTVYILIILKAPL